MKHLELFKQGFDSTLAEKVRPENWPFVGHDVLSGEVVYTAIPTSVEGPADNEIWYTTVDKLPVTLVWDVAGTAPSNQVIANSYSNDIGKLQFDETVTGLGMTNNNNNNGYLNLITLFGNLYAPIDEPWQEQLTSTIKTIILPASITTLIGSVFLGCDKLESIIFMGTKEQWSQINIIPYPPLDSVPNYTYISTVTGHPWNKDNKVAYIPATVVHCTDGDVEI